MTILPCFWAGFSNANKSTSAVAISGKPVASESWGGRKQPRTCLPLIATRGRAPPPLLPLSWTPAAQLPTFLHFCQSYSVKGSRSGSWRFGKRSVSKDLFRNCDATPLPRPPSNASMLQPEASRMILTSKQKPKLTKEEKAIRDVKRSAFMVCTVTSYVNEAMTRHKSEFCQLGG